MSDSTTPESTPASQAEPTSATEAASLAPTDTTVNTLPTTPLRTGIGTAALVLGIAALVLGAIKGPSYIAFIPAILAIVFGALALARRLPVRGRSLAGLILGSLGLIVAISVSAAGIAAPTTHIAADQPANVKAAPAAPKATPTPKVTPIPANVSYTGTGDSVVKIALPDGAGSAGFATINYTGGDNFTVWSLDSSLQQQDLMVNTIGSYSGTVLFNLAQGSDAQQLQLTASGPWTVTLESIRSLPDFTGTTASGTGDAVLVYRGNAGAATIQSSGRDNFVVWEYGNQSNLLVNEIGAYNGTVVMGAGPALVEVESDGPWNIAVG
jgi:hypothetical protein